MDEQVLAAKKNAAVMAALYGQELVMRSGSSNLWLIEYQLDLVVLV